jgi:hypothetical protein
LSAILTLGDLVIVGKTVLRFNHPEEAAKMRETSQVNEVVMLAKITFFCDLSNSI